MTDRRARLAVALAATTLLATAARGEDPVSWVKGPRTVDLGETAQLALPEGFVFADGPSARKLLEQAGNTTDGTEVGLIAPASETESWMVIFEYHDVGHVKDDEKDAIDKDAILDGIREGTEEGNKRRKEMGVPALHVRGWHEEPHYDERTHNLVWAIAAEEEGGGAVVNHNVRLLGRRGYMSVTLVEDPVRLAVSKGSVDRMMAGFEYKTGQRYAEFRPGDKVAEYGLAALVAGGAGAAAAKFGLFAALGKLLAKGGKALVVVAVGALALLRKLFGRRSDA